MKNEIQNILNELQKVIVGKQAALTKLLVAIFADGHILLDDVPGVGKTSIATAISKVMGLGYKRIQFTPDVLPSDITGFSVYNKETGKLTYMPGAAIGANILLGDEINRTSSKTQSALLEAMEERQVTVDGTTHALANPFIVIATQNNVGTAGTQLLPFAQLERFLMRLSLGYPDIHAQIAIIRDRQTTDPMENIAQVVSLSDVIKMQHEVQHVTIKDSVIKYIAELAEASRNNESIELGISPRGALFIAKTAKARAYVLGRDYVIPEDVREVLVDVCAHRIILSGQAKAAKIVPEQVVQNLIQAVKVPDGI